MATRALLCPECGATVTAGRLSCLECGALLAAVAGVGRRAMQTVAAPQSSTPAAPVPLMAVPQVPVPQGERSSEPVQDPGSARSTGPFGSTTALRAETPGVGDGPAWPW